MLSATAVNKQQTTQRKSAAGSNAAAGISLPAVSILQQKETEDPIREFSARQKSIAQLAATDDTRLKSFQLKPNNTTTPYQMKPRVEGQSGIRQFIPLNQSVNPGKKVMQLFGAGTLQEKAKGEAFEQSLQEYSELNSLIEFRLEIQAEAYAGTPQEAEIRSELFAARSRKNKLKKTILQQWPGIKQESLDPYYRPLVDTIISEDAEDKAPAPQVAAADHRLGGLLDYFSNSWGMEPGSTAFQSRIQRLQLVFVRAYPTGNCHGYTLHRADEQLDFSIPEWKKTRPRIVVYTLGTKVGHSAELSGGGRITQTFSGGHPLFSCDMGAFDEFVAGTYDGRFVLPDQLDELIERIQYHEQSPQEMAFLELLDELGKIVRPWEYEDGRKYEVAVIIRDMYEFTPQNVELLDQLKEEIPKLKGG